MSLGKETLMVKSGKPSRNVFICSIEILLDPPFIKKQKLSFVLFIVMFMVQ